MFIATCVVSVLFALVLVVSACGKLMDDRAQMETLRKVGFPERRVWLLAMAEIAGGVGLVLGLLYWPIGVAAAIGVIGYFVGAIVSHLRVRDWQITPAAVLLVVGAAGLVLRLITA